MVFISHYSPDELEKFDVDIASFMSLDPLRTNPNGYEFVNNDPVNAVDRNGKCPICGVGESCMKQYMNEKGIVVADFEEIFSDYSNYYGISLLEAVHVAYISSLDHSMQTSETIAAEIKFAKKLMGLKKNLDAIQLKYLENFPPEMRPWISTLYSTQDLLTLQPEKFMNLSTTLSLNAQDWNRVKRISRFRFVPSLEYFADDAMTRLGIHAQYASEVQAATNNFAQSVEALENPYEMRIRSFMASHLTWEPMSWYGEIQRRLYTIPERSRLLISPSNPLLTGYNNIGDKRYLLQYMMSKHHPFNTFDLKAKQYFPESFITNFNSRSGHWNFPGLL